MSVVKGPALTVELCLVVALSTMFWRIATVNVGRRQVGRVWLAENGELWGTVGVAVECGDPARSGGAEFLVECWIE